MNPKQPTPEAPHRPRRITQTEILESFLAKMTQQGAERSSVTLSRAATSKGVKGIEVVIRTGGSVEDIHFAFAQAQFVFDAALAKYPEPTIEPVNGDTP